MKFHWKVLLWMVAGVVLGVVLQRALGRDAWDGGEWRAVEGGVELTATTPGGPLAKSKLSVGDVVTAVVLERGVSGLPPDEGGYGERGLAVAARPDRSRRDPGIFELFVPVTSLAAYEAALAERADGGALWLEDRDGELRLLTPGLDPTSTLARAVYPFGYLADIFMALLKMLIVPIVLTSIITGVAGVGNARDLGRLGGKTFAYYIGTSLLAILTGQVLVSIVRPGIGANLGLSSVGADDFVAEAGFLDVLKRMVPTNVFESFGQNGAMLQVIFFALLFGYFITRTPAPHGDQVKGLFESLFQVVLRLAEGILKLLPYGVFCLLVRVVATTGFGIFAPLLQYMAVVTVALVLHAGVTLPLILRFVGRMSPLRWFKAMSPALMTAFSTSSSSMTLPVTLDTVEMRGKVSRRVTSFTLPLGATINMDGTALYECVGVVFLAQYYSSTGDFDFTLSKQLLVVFMALTASIGAAGIPSAGLVMMLAILAALGLPIEGAALLLAVDRPLDMMRTVVNVWSDSCGAALIARTEGEEGPLTAGDDPPPTGVGVSGP